MSDEKGAMTKPELDLEAIRRRCEAATAGRWVRWEAENGALFVAGGGYAIAQLSTRDGDADALDAEFIAHAREDLPKCMDRIVELEAEVERLQSELARRGSEEAVQSAFGEAPVDDAGHAVQRSGGPGLSENVPCCVSQQPAAWLVVTGDDQPYVVALSEYGARMAAHDPGGPRGVVPLYRSAPQQPVAQQSADVEDAIERVLGHIAVEKRFEVRESLRRALYRSPQHGANE